MCQRPNWLPEIINCDGDWSQVAQRLYAIFEDHFKINPPMFQQRRVLISRDKSGSLYEITFWHLIGGNHLTPDFRRAERIGWCRPLIVHYDDPRVFCFDYMEKSKECRTYFWLKECDYVVVIQKERKHPIAHLVTGYHLDGKSGLRKVCTKYTHRARLYPKSGQTRDDPCKDNK